MKMQFAILWILLLICLPAFETIGQNSQPIEPLKPKELLTNNDNDFKPKEILTRYNSDVTKPYLGFEKNWSLTQKSIDLSDRQTVFDKVRNQTKQTKSKFEYSLDSDSKQLSAESSNPKYEGLYFEIPIGLMRTITSKGDYGNSYFIGIISLTGISNKIDFSFSIFTLGWGRTAKDIQYYHETWDAGSKTFGLSAFGRSCDLSKKK